jgi:hypothetical protein
VGHKIEIGDESLAVLWGDKCGSEGHIKFYVPGFNIAKFIGNGYFASLENGIDKDKGESFK